LRGPLLRPGQSGFSACPAEFAPNKASHIIIFSIGMTRIAEAPAAFSF
jgi:hypothetical protein